MISVPRLSHILVAADATTRLLLRNTLERAGYKVSLVGDGLEAQRAILETRYDALLIDVDLPGRTAAELCREVRLTSGLPIMLLAEPAREATAIAGLDAGADDFVRKPLVTREVLARVRAALRRVRFYPATTYEPVRTGRLAVDLVHNVASFDDRDLRLTGREGRVLSCLARSLGRTVPTTHILSEVWGEHFAKDVLLVHINISRVRHKLEPVPSSPVYIKTVPKVGYQLMAFPVVTRCESEQATPRSDASPG